MLCPKCRKDMLILEFERVEVDHCAECGGVWLDSGELALMGRRAGPLHTDLLQALEKEEGEPQPTRPKRRCPVCHKPLLCVRAAGERDIQVEKCPRNDGLWFEAGTLPAVIKAESKNGENVFARFLADLDAQRSQPAQRRPQMEGGG